MSEANPEIGGAIATGGYQTNYHDVGAGEPVLLLHGSGPGATGWANWRGAIPVLKERYRVVAPDLVGFGYTERPAGMTYRIMDTWVEQILHLLDALKIDRTNLVGNSFGGALSLHLAVRAPERIGKIVLMGSSGVPMQLTPELDALWGYTPSFENMRQVMKNMAYNQALVTDELVELRLRASLRPGTQDAFAALFPAPRERWIAAQLVPQERLRAIPHPTLIIHGRDDRIVPLDTSLQLLQAIDDARLHVFGRCGHWTMIEQRDRFNALVLGFLSE
jgi:2-hydroxymuconate-semialdehyde hydrolase